MSSFENEMNLEVSFTENEIEGSERESIEAILVSMYNEQSEHMYHKFSEAYIKVR